MPVPARSRSRTAPSVRTRAAGSGSAAAPTPSTRSRRVTPVAVEAIGTLQAAATALAADRDPSFVAPAPVRRPRLRVVDEAARRAQLARQRRARFIVTLVVAVVVGSVFALAAAHAYLVSGQSKLDRLTAQVEQARATYSRSRLEVAQLGSPARIVTEATSRLGMVTPATTRYLSPSSQLAVEVGAVDPGSPSSDSVNAGAPWYSVKPYLGASK